MKKEIKTAIIHDVFDKYGGSESVALSFLKMFPRSDVYTFLVDPDIKKKIEKRARKIKTSWWQGLWNVFGLGKFRAILKLVSWIYWLRLDLSEYDLVISSSHSYGCKMVRVPNGLHISYIHTPPKYLYMDEYELNIFPLNMFFIIIKPILRLIDRYGARSPDVLVANSNEVRKRIKKFYKRESVVINPPVDIREGGCEREKEYYICFSRLVRQKGIDLVVQTCSKSNIPLLVVGDGPERKRLELMAGKSVRFWGYCEEKDKEKVFSKAKALIFTAVDEDFGIVPVESMTYGVPVIGYKSGGLKETVVDGKTGILFSDYSIEGLKTAIEKFEKVKIMREECLNRAKMYTLQVFEKKVKALVSSQLRTKRI